MKLYAISVFNINSDAPAFVFREKLPEAHQETHRDLVRPVVFDTKEAADRQAEESNRNYGKSGYRYTVVEVEVNV